MTARPITDTASDAVLSRIASPNELDAWIEGSPLVELTKVSRVTAAPRRARRIPQQR
jgi:hypothetical protein